MKGLEHIKLITTIGLAGVHYKACRLNVGFIFGDYLASDLGRFALNNQEIMIYKPLTNSKDQIGSLIYKAANALNIRQNEMLLAHYDMKLDCGIYKLFNGERYPYQGVGQLKRAFFGSQTYHRLSLGVGLPKTKLHATTYLLSQVPDKEMKKYNRMFRHFYQTRIEISQPQLLTATPH